MGKGREIKGRMKAVGNIQRITKTMQMIATAKFQASQRRATAAQPYARKITELVSELGAAGGAVEHPLLQSPDPAVGRHLLLVLTSNRGLCGGYNANVLRTAVGFIQQQEDQVIDFEVVGKKGLAYCKFSGIEVAAFHSEITDTPTYESVERLGDRYMQAFKDGQYDTLHVVYMAFHSAARQTPMTLPLLPLRGLNESEKKTSESSAQHDSPMTEVIYDFSPQPNQLLDELLPIAFKTQLLQCFNEAVVSEHVARMVAMKSATDNAGKMGKELSRSYNRARQAAITTELSEIIAGSAALN